MIRNRALLLALFTALTAPIVLAQQAPPAPPAAPHVSRDMKDKGMNHFGPDRGGMGIVPPGTWWKNPAIIADLSLTAD